MSEETKFREFELDFRNLLKKHEILIRDLHKRYGLSYDQIKQIRGIKSKPLERDETVEINALCHRCQQPFITHPVKGVVFPAYVCQRCAND